MQAGLSVGYGNQETLTCVVCEFVGQQPAGLNTTPATILLLDTAVHCQKVVSMDDYSTALPGAASLVSQRGLSTGACRSSG